MVGPVSRGVPDGLLHALHAQLHPRIALPLDRGRPRRRRGRMAHLLLCRAATDEARAGRAGGHGGGPGDQNHAESGGSGGFIGRDSRLLDVYPSRRVAVGAAGQRYGLGNL